MSTRRCYTELQEMRRHYFIERKTLCEAAQIPLTSMSLIETGYHDFTTKYFHALLDAYARLGFKNAKYQLYYIYLRDNPAIKESDDGASAASRLVRGEFQMGVNGTAQRIPKPDPVFEVSLPGGS